jgi:hypothetical protein
VGNVEYDIPKLCNLDDTLDNEKCVHTLTTVQMLHGQTTTPFGTGSIAKDQGKYVNVMYMVGHLHHGGMVVSAYDNA